MAPSPLAMAPRDLPPLTAASVPCCNMVGEGVARGGSSSPRALQSHAQLSPRPLPPPPPPPWGRRGEALGFTPSTADTSLFLRTDTSLPPFYVLVYVGDLVFATADTEALTLVKSELQKRHTCTDLGPSALRLPVLLATAHSSVYQPLALSSTFGRVLRRAWGSCLEDGVQLSSLVTQTLLGSSCEAEIYAGAMAAHELRWLTYLVIDLGEQPRSPPVLYVDNKAMIALCQEHILEHIMKHIAVRYFLAR
ncbi:unnamed protein product [Closterium sp. NIES-53]